MSSDDPKRHHWWPQLNSGYWCAADGLITVTRRDGTVFRAPPKELGVRKHLYSYEIGNERDASLEKWLAHEIDTPFDIAAKGILSSDREKAKLRAADKENIRQTQDLGFIYDGYVEFWRISSETRASISNYIAALLVRNPNYIGKMAKFHKKAGADEADLKNLSLDNMLHVYDVYRKVIFETAEFLMVEARGGHEFMFTDGGISAEEPWSKLSGLPFDIHFPLTPRYALQIFPVPQPAYFDAIVVVGASNRGVAGQNRLSLQSAGDQVFTKSAPPLNFIMKHWGKEAPKFIGKRRTQEGFEVFVDWSRHS